LELSRNKDNVVNCMVCIEMLALVQLKARSLASAAQLAGAAEAARERLNTPMQGHEVEEYHQLIKALRARRYKPDWAKGRALSLDEAIELALQICVATP
jgi:hypothetical protein